MRGLGRVFGVVSRSASRRRFAAALVFTGMIVLGVCRPAYADQPQDWMIAAGKPGTFMNLDFIFGAVQAGIEHRMKVYGGANQFTLRGSALAALPFGSTQADAELRLLNLTLGLTVGGQSIWRNQRFAADAIMDRKERRVRDSAGEFNTDTFGFFEGRAGLAFPFNDYVVLNHVTAWRMTGSEGITFDNAIGTVDDGRYVRTDFQLFLKDKDFGGFAPMFQILNFPLNNKWHTQYNYGFAFVTRAGLIGRDDLILWQMLFHSGPVLGGGYDNRDVYGAALFRAPLTFLLVYRSVINLWTPPRSEWDDK